jgi:hypothetical protein
MEVLPENTFNDAEAVETTVISGSTGTAMASYQCRWALGGMLPIRAQHAVCKLF